MMRWPYGLKIVIREPLRFLPAMLAVTFSAVLVSMQSGLLLGFLRNSSRPIERISADLWIGSRDFPALGYSHPIDESLYARIASQPEVTAVEPYLYGITMWHNRSGRLEQCYVVGARLEEGAVGVSADLEDWQRAELARLGAVAMYDPDRRFLRLQGVGDVGEINGARVQVVAILQGESKAAGLMPGLLCSLRTARRILPGVGPDQTTFLIARCADPASAAMVARRLNARYGNEMSVHTRDDMIWTTRSYWLTKTRAGLVLAFSAALGLLVGAVITSMTFYSATAAARRELAVLRALGIPGRHVIGMLLSQAVAVGLAGALLAVPATLGLRQLGLQYNVQAHLPPELLAGVAALTLVTAMLAGLAALASLRLIEPTMLLR